jgi:hypothetical protein
MGVYLSFPKGSGEIQSRHSYAYDLEPHREFDDPSQTLDWPAPLSPLPMNAENYLQKESGGFSAAIDVSLAEFQVSASRNNTSGHNCHQASSKSKGTAPSADSKSSTESYQPRIVPKRSRKEEGQNGEDEDDGHDSDHEPAGNRGTKARKKEDQTLTFACPFWKRDPYHQTDCMNYKLKRFRDVKQHLQGKHYEPYFPICYQTFSSPSDRDDHIRSKSYDSQSRPAPNSLNGVSQEAKTRLSSRIDRPTNAIQQWYFIWDTLFRGEPRPESPYLGTVFEENFGMIRDVWAREGSDIIDKLLPRREEGEGLSEVEALLPDMMCRLFNALQYRLQQRAQGTMSTQSPGAVAGNCHDSLVTTNWLCDRNASDTGISVSSSISDGSEPFSQFTFTSSLDMASPTPGDMNPFQFTDNSLFQLPIIDCGLEASLNGAGLFEPAAFEIDWHDVSFEVD